MPLRRPPDEIRTRRVTYVLGSTAEYVRLTPVAAEVRRRLPHLRQILVGTSGGEDNGPASLFEEELGVPELSYVLEVGGAAGHLAHTLDRLERVLELEHPDLVLVAGDGTAALAAALAAAMRAVPVARLEAETGRFDPVGNSVVTRRIIGEVAALHFARSQDATERMLAQGVASERVHLVGSTMIDALVGLERRLARTDAPAREGLRRRGYLLVVPGGAALANRPTLWGILDRLRGLSDELPVALAIDAELERLLRSYPLSSRIRRVGPLDYLDSLSLVSQAGGVLTDSADVEEQAVHFGVPCLAVDEPLDPEAAAAMQIDVSALAAAQALDGRPLLADGRASKRVADVLEGALTARPASPPTPCSGRSSREGGRGRSSARRRGR